MFYGIIGAAGNGFTYMVPMICGWDYFPERRGLITGIIMAAYGFGSFMYVLIAKAIINPDDE